VEALQDFLSRLVGAAAGGMMVVAMGLLSRKLYRH